jgi:hypothetical protein
VADTEEWDMETTGSLRAAAALAKGLEGLGMACDVNGDSAGEEVFLALPDNFTLCVAGSVEAAGYDWQILDADRDQVLAGTWAHVDPAAAAELVQALVRGLGDTLTR